MLLTMCSSLRCHVLMLTKHAMSVNNYFMFEVMSKSFTFVICMYRLIFPVGTFRRSKPFIPLSVYSSVI